MKKLFFIFALLAVMVMQVPQASAAGPPGQEEISIALCTAQADVQYVAQYAMMPEVSFAADLPVLFIRQTNGFYLNELFLVDCITYKHPPNSRDGLMIAKISVVRNSNGMLPEVRKWAMNNEV